MITKKQAREFYAEQFDYSEGDGQDLFESCWRELRRLMKDPPQHLASMIGVDGNEFDLLKLIRFNRVNDIKGRFFGQ